MRQIKLGGKSTYDDYGLFIAPTPTIEPAEPKTMYVDIPYGDGSIDLSESITGNVVYNDREINFTMFFLGDDITAASVEKRLKNELHGKKMQIEMPQFPGYFFEGRVKIEKSTIEKSVAYFPVSVTASPYMLKKEITIASHTLTSSGVLNLVLSNERMITMPTFRTSAATKITFGGKSHSYTAGTFQSTGILLKEGNNPIKIEAVAGTTIEISYQEGAL